MSPCTPSTIFVLINKTKTLQEMNEGALGVMELGLACCGDGR
jgi:hypothetical protein